ncbi:MAG: hypothetical protein KF774_08255 [Planctomyces sp.]|nr:hypothetical protein [Planctomyces sp.]
MKRQAVLAMVGGGCLGVVLGIVLGALLGGSMISVEAWEDQELYGFIGLARRVRGMGIGGIVGGLAGLLAGAWFGGRPPGDDGRHRPD